MAKRDDPTSSSLVNPFEIEPIVDEVEKSEKASPIVASGEKKLRGFRVEYGKDGSVIKSQPIYE